VDDSRDQAIVPNPQKPLIGSALDRDPRSP
jgi:hypothetical protein